MSDIHKPEDFDQIYRGGGWNGLGSGPGSTELFTRQFRVEFENLLTNLKIKSVFDLGCGDWRWQRHVKWPDGLRYAGWDVADLWKPDFGSPFGVSELRFRVDAFLEPIWPETDLLLVKDVVHHLSKFRVRQLIEKAKLYDYVLWVVDVQSESDWSPCNWPSGKPFPGEPIYVFDLSVENYPFGPKIAALQTNP